MEGSWDDEPIEEEEEPTSEWVGGLELIFGRSRSGYKDVYPHRKKWQAKVFVEGKGVCSLGIFKSPRQAAIKVAQAKAAGLYLLPSPDKTRAKPGCGGVSFCCRNPFDSLISLSNSCCVTCVAAVKRKLSSTPLVIPTYSLESLENHSQQQPPVPVRLLAPADRMKACVEGMPAALAQPVAAPGPMLSTQKEQPCLLPDGGRLLGR